MTIASNLEFDGHLVCETHNIWGCIILFKYFQDINGFSFLLYKPIVNMLIKICTKC